MRKLSFLILLSSIISIIFISCNKDDAVTNSGTGGTPVVVTNTFPKTGSVPIILGETNDILTIDSSGTINSLSFALNDIENVNAVNVDIFLVHGGVTDTLLYRTTNNGTNFINTVFSDTASTSIQNGSGDFTGYFKPYSPLSKFNGLNINGQWTLKFISRVNQRTGVIKSWGITITYNRVQTPTTVLMPLAVGNKWVYTMDSSGVILPEDTLYIPSTGNYNGKTVYQLYESRKPYNEMYLGYENTDLWGYSIIQNISRLMFKYPVSVGEWWIGGGSGDSTVCLSINETVVTPSGTYTGCIKYQSFDGPYDVSIEYFKPGVGLVGTDKSGRIQRLKAFNPPPATLQIFPTAVGNQWILEQRDQYGFRGYDSLNIIYSITYQGKTLYRLTGENPNDTMYVNNESDGCYMYFYQNYVLTNRLLFKYPISAGTMYIGGADGFDTIYCTSVNATITTPSGTYTDCIRYEQHKNGVIGTISHVKPGLGLVALDHNNGDYERLYYYHLNK